MNKLLARIAKYHKAYLFLNKLLYKGLEIGLFFDNQMPKYALASSADLISTNFLSFNSRRINWLLPL